MTDEASAERDDLDLLLATLDTIAQSTPEHVALARHSLARVRSQRAITLLRLFAVERSRDFVVSAGRSLRKLHER